MAIASDNKFPKVILEERASNGSDTGNPAADHRALFLGEDGLLHLRDSSGTVTEVGSQVADILDLPTAETDDTLVLAPDGAGGVEFRAEAGGGGGGGITHTMLGYDTIGGSDESMLGDTWYLKKVTVSTAGVITSIGGYFGETSDAVYSWICGVWSDNGGNVDSPLGFSGLPGNYDYAPHDSSGVARTFIHRPIGVYVPAADYWIGVARVHMSSGGLTLAYDGSGSDRTVGQGGTWVSDFTGRTQTNTTRKYSIRASLIS